MTPTCVQLVIESQSSIANSRTRSRMTTNQAHPRRARGRSSRPTPAARRPRTPRSRRSRRTSPTTSAAQLARVAGGGRRTEGRVAARQGRDRERRAGMAQADVAKAHKYAIERFAEDLLPVKDALEQTLAARDVSLDTLQVRRRADAEGAAGGVRPRAGRRDRTRSARSSTRTSTRRCRWSTSDQPANTVVTVFQKGYLSTTACCGRRS